MRSVVSKDITWTHSFIWTFDVSVSFVTCLYSYDDTETCEVI